MKKVLYLLSGLIIAIGFSVNANASNTKADTSFYNRGYGNSFIFVERGIEFSVFPDGQFDFYIPQYGPNINVALGAPSFSISFNSGYNYTPYVQYDEFGAIIQIENTPIFYDYYGRISQVGNVNIYYNNFGSISRVGGLFVHYNRFNNFSHCSGFINIYNRNYVFRPWHSYYRVPARNFCVVYNRPYRQYYNPVRYRYTRPFYNNNRVNTAVARRRGNTVYRSKQYATANRSSRNVGKISKYNRSIQKNNTSRISRNDNTLNQRNSVSNKTRSNTINNSVNSREKVRLNNDRLSSVRAKNNKGEVRKRLTKPSNTRMNQVTRNRTSSSIKKPTRNNSRIYKQNNTKTRSNTVQNRVTNRKPVLKQRNTISSNTKTNTRNYSRSNTTRPSTRRR